MKTNLILNSIRVSCLASVLALAAVSGANAQTAKPPMSQASMPHAEMKGAMAGDMKKSMMAGMEKMNQMPMSGNIDKDFAMMMKIHHQGALDMAEMELAQGKSAEMKAMAKKIIAAQKKEIAEFDKWLAKQK